jgi:hypothetical protein
VNNHNLLTNNNNDKKNNIKVESSKENVFQKQKNELKRKEALEKVNFPPMASGQAITSNQDTKGAIGEKNTEPQVQSRKKQYQRIVKKNKGAYEDSLAEGELLGNKNLTDFVTYVEDRTEKEYNDCLSDYLS